MNVELLSYPTESDWLFVKQCALVTVGKKAIRPPDGTWKSKILNARHSVIRELRFAFVLADIPFYVMGHLVRHHVGFQPYVKTSRQDRTGIDRNERRQTDPVDMILSLNAEALMTLANKRLCMMADEKTREIVRLMCDEAATAMPEIAAFLVPMCEYHGGVCHEIQSCGRCKQA